MKLFYKLCLIGLLLFMVAGCNKKETEKIESDSIVEESGTTTTDGVKEEQEKEVVPSFGGTLNVASHPIKTLDPLQNNRQSVLQFLGLIYEPLFDLDTSLKPVANLIATYSFDASGKELTLTLKKDINFHNDTPLTSKDVAYTISQIKEIEQSPYKHQVQFIKRVRIIDEQQLIIYYDKGYSFILNDLSFPIVSSDYRESDTYDPLKPMGTGPYKFKNYQQMQFIDLTANLNWHAGKVMVETIHNIILQAGESFETLFDQHLIDVMHTNKFDWLKYSENEDQRIETFLSSYYDFIGFNFDNPLLKRKEVRQAMAYAINRQTLSLDYFINHIKLVDAPILPNTWFTGTSEAFYTYDLTKAKSLLPIDLKDGDTDGFIDTVDLVESDKYNKIVLKMIVNQNQPIRVSTATYLANSFKSLGIFVEVEVLETELYYKRIQAGDYDLIYGGWKLSQVPDYVALFDTFGEQNFIHYSNENMDIVLEDIVGSSSEEKLIKNVSEFKQMIIEDLPYISLYFLEGAVITHKNVYGTFDTTTENYYRSIENIYVAHE